MRRLILLAATCILVPPAAAVNKCVSAEGDVVIYTDRLCPHETQRVSPRDNTIQLEAIDRQRLANERARSAAGDQAAQRARAEQDAQVERIRAAQQAVDQERASRNSTVVPIVPRTPQVENPPTPVNSITSY